MSFAAPVANGKFSFSVDSFYVETSGHNLHRRATVPELQTLFQPAAAGAAAPPDPVGHWYEAQLLHYGIAPSKNKAVAKMRLLDAVRGGGLAVPKDISKIEADLKKEWKKKDKEAKTGKSEGTETKTATTAKSGGGKRKRDGEEETETAQPAKTTAKKTAETNKKPASTAKAEAKPKPEPKKTTAAAKKKDETAKKDPEPAPRGQTAKRGGRGGSTTSSRSNANASVPEPEPPRPRKKQTARRSGGPPLVSRERKATPPPAYSEFPNDAVGPRLPLF